MGRKVRRVIYKDEEKFGEIELEPDPYGRRIVYDKNGTEWAEIEESGIKGKETIYRHGQEWGEIDDYTGREIVYDKHGREWGEVKLEYKDYLTFADIVEPIVGPAIERFIGLFNVNKWLERWNRRRTRKVSGVERQALEEEKEFRKSSMENSEGRKRAHEIEGLAKELSKYAEGLKATAKRLERDEKISEASKYIKRFTDYLLDVVMDCVEKASEYLDFEDLDEELEQDATSLVALAEKLEQDEKFCKEASKILRGYVIHLEDDIIQYLEKVEEARVRKLSEEVPRVLVDLVVAEDTAIKIAKICYENGIKENERIEAICYQTGRVLLGSLYPEKFQRTLEEEVGLSSLLAQKIAREIYESIFYPVKDSLTSLYSS